MRCECLSFSNLGPDQMAAWQRLRQAGFGLDSPFLHPGFLGWIARAYGDVEVGWMERNGEIALIWPFQRVGRHGRSVASDVCDLTGVIAADDLHWEPLEVMPRLGLRRWDYDCVPIAQRALRPFHVCERTVPQIRLEGGFAAYCHELKRRGSRGLSDAWRKRRRLELDWGPVRFEWHDPHPDALASLIRHKRRRYQATGVRDKLTRLSTRNLLATAQQESTGDLRGVLSVLSLGDRQIAWHLGLVSGSVMALWFPTYDVAFARYSPGSILFSLLLEEAAARGVQRVDMGQGDERFKRSLSNAEFPVGEGVVHRSPWTRWTRRARSQARDWAGNSALGRSLLRYVRTERSLGPEPTP